MNTEETTTPLTAVDENIVNLDTPIVRGKTYMSSLTLRKPCSGELRGVHLVDLLNLDVAALLKVLPRITSPSITVTEAAGMDPADLLACGNKVAHFLLQKSVRTDASLVA